MYVPFFGLAREPFSIAPDPRFLFMSERHREALAHLLYGVGGGGGFVLLTGEIGAGKTTVCRCFLEQIPPHCAVAYIFNPRLTVAELLQTVCDEFGIAVPPRPPGETGVKPAVDALNAFLLRAHAEGRSAVLIIDEAQSLAPDVLEQLRLLTNLETAERKLLQIILIGQPELREMLARPDMEQLAQRVIARYHLGPLSREETALYVRHRLAVAGAQARMPFEPAALACIHRLTGGVPRRINLLADRALLGAYTQQRAQVDKRTAEQAAREVFARPADGVWPRRLPAAGVALAGAALVGVGLGGALWALWPQRQSAPAPLAATPAASSPAAVAASPPASPAASPADEVAVNASGSSAPALAAEAARPADQATPPVAEVDAPASADPGAVLAAAHTEEGIAWRELALRWNVAIGEGDACVAAAQVRLMCLPRTIGGLPVVRQLDRPGIVTLRAGNGRPVWALLVGLREDEVTLQAGAQRFRLTLPALAAVWRGEFATFWRAPAGWREGAKVAADPVLGHWVTRQLDAAGVTVGAPLPERVRVFQLAQGLPPDGVAGPLTLMRLNRSAGVDEPTLAGGR
ncbi:MAG: AAA family ATPase [Rubrivivax sp.]|nr:AAA family ATPase [Rubrivivax sp.]